MQSSLDSELELVKAQSQEKTLQLQTLTSVSYSQSN